MRRWHEEPRRSERDNEWGGRRDDRNTHRDARGSHMSHRDDHDSRRGQQYGLSRAYGSRGEDQGRSYDGGGRGYERRDGRDSYRESYPDSRRHNDYDRRERHERYDTRHERPHPDRHYDDRRHGSYDQRHHDDQRWMERQWKGEDFDDYSYGQYRRDVYRHDHPGYERSGSELEHRGRPRDVRGRESFGDYDGRNGRGRHHQSSGRHEEREKQLDPRDFEEYKGRDYGFSWSDGSNDATWREFDRWGNEYSNHARSEGFGWNRGSTRDPHFWSSPDRER